MTAPGEGSRALTQPQENAVSRDVAVIDIGSNSVRLVHFRLEGRALWPVFNEKVSAGLGRGVETDGRLHPEGVETAVRTLKRFAQLMEAKAVSERIVVATAAVRLAEDGAAFLERVRAETGLEPRLLSGEEEARLSALGVIAGCPGAAGVAGDLGGASLELTCVEGGRTGAGVTLSLGPMSFRPKLLADYKALKAAIDERLAPAVDILTNSGDRFYAVGGAWRALAQLSMTARGYPLRVLHQYALTRDEVSKIADFASKTSPEALAGTPGMSNRRAETLPFAGLILKRLMKLGKFKRVVFSAYGLREGAMFDRMPESLQREDPLAAAADSMTRPAAPSPGFGAALSVWTERIFERRPELFGPGADRRLRDAAARMTDLGARFHPDHRADLAREQVLYAPFAGATHPERAFLALAIHYRYAGYNASYPSSPFDALLNAGQREAAQALGLALRLGAGLSGRSVALLNRFAVSLDGGSLTLVMPQAVSGLAVENALNRFHRLAQALEARPVIVET
ncbi:MAG: Ppx/GppA family phosphatase [Maricaulaceae bacterium]|nr:Ppx/GppA family phosphatase [Maricaulaceae bacterium]